MPKQTHSINHLHLESGLSRDTVTRYLASVPDRRPGEDQMLGGSPEFWWSDLIEAIGKKNTAEIKSLNEETAALKAAQRKHTETRDERDRVKLAVERGELIGVAEAAQEMEQVMTALRRRILSLPVEAGEQDKMLRLLQSEIEASKT